MNKCILNHLIKKTIMKKLLLLLFIGLLFSNDIYCQRKTTSVKGYYRKNGTYVRPHTRTYNSSSSNVGTYSYSPSTNNDKAESYGITSLSFLTTNNSEIKDSTISKNNRSKEEIKPSELINVEENEEGVIFYVSVLRYNGKTIDICPIKRDYSDEWDFNDVKHVVNKNDLSTEQALDLVSNYSWSIKAEKMTKSFYSFSKTELPDYLSKTIEAIKVQ